MALPNPVTVYINVVFTLLPLLKVAVNPVRLKLETLTNKFELEEFGVI